MKKIIISISIGVIVLLILSFIFIAKNEQIKKQNVKTLKIGEITLNVKIANTNAERIKGLSGKKSLGENEGLLFIFKKEDYHGIWMKNMKFPIDIAWINKDKKIIYIENNVSPDTYPKVFYAFKNNLPMLSFYILETKANFFEKYEIKTGNKLKF